MRTLQNVALFQAGWFACVLGAAAGYAWLGPLVVGLVLGIHLVVLGHRDEAGLVGWSALAGAVADSLLAASGLVSYAAHPGPGLLAPVWIVAMWANFAITLRHSLAWLSGRWLLAALLGAIGGPLAYVAGSRLGPIQLAPGALVALGVVWGAALPFLTALARSRRTSDTLAR